MRSSGPASIGYAGEKRAGGNGEGGMVCMDGARRGGEQLCEES